MKEEKVFCYFHNDDMDGWASSAIVKGKHPNAKFYGYNYEPDFPLVKDSDIVYMVDCSTTSANMKYLIENNKKFVWIDHHAKKILDIHKELGENIPGLRDTESKNSACVLTWKYLFPDEDVPELLEIIEDIDIWKWKLPHTDEINTTLSIEYKDRLKILKLIQRWRTTKPLLITTGNTYIKMRKSQIKHLLELMQIKTFHNYKTGVINTPINTSFTAHEILEQNPDIDIALIWHMASNTIRVSLRSRDNVDVSKIAHIYGGGGHKQASGFSLTNINDFHNLFKGDKK